MRSLDASPDAIRGPEISDAERDVCTISIAI